MKTHIFSLLVATAALFALTGYNCNDVLLDPGFDLWCGETLCSWELESGQIERAPTWHSSDAGVSMVGDDVAFSQFVDRSSEDLTCLRFELIADVEETAEVTLQLDLNNNGMFEHEQRIPTSRWQQLSYLIRMPLTYQGIRFRLHKRGGGRAVLAEVAALSENVSECADAPRVLSQNGGLCNVDGQCASELCVRATWWGDSACSACSHDSDCGAGEVCGLVAPDEAALFPYRACIAEASRGLGERCHVDGECLTGLCVDSACSTCAADSQCPVGQQCQVREDAELGAWLIPPRQCDPMSGRAQAGQVCLTGSDCVSGQCSGTGDMRLCLSDSRACVEDDDCPGSALGFSGNLAVCATVGTAHGVCE